VNSEHGRRGQAEDCPPPVIHRSANVKQWPYREAESGI